MVHQGYIEPHACLASAGAGGEVEVWCSTQGAFSVRAQRRAAARHRHCRRPRDPDRDRRRLRRQDHRLPRAARRRAVAQVRPAGEDAMTREEVFRATGPTSRRHGVAEGRREIRRHHHRDGRPARVRGRRLPRLAGAAGAMTMFTCYDVPHLRALALDVVTNSRRSRPIVLPGRPMAQFAVECALDELALRLGIDPVELRLRNAVREGIAHHLRRRLSRPSASSRCLEAARRHRALRGAARREPGARRRRGFLVQRRRRVQRRGAHHRGRQAAARGRATPISAARAPRWR